MLRIRALSLTAFQQAAWLLLLGFPIAGTGHQLPPVAPRSAASPNVQITEASAHMLVERNLAQRAINPCTQWSVIGSSGLGCSTSSYPTVVTTLATTFPGVSTTTTFSSPDSQWTTFVSTTFVWSTSTTPTVTQSSNPTTPVPSYSVKSPTPTTFATSSTPITSAISSASSTVVFSAYTTPPTISSTTPSLAVTPSSTTSSSAISSPSLLPCSDSQWEPTPQNWLDADVDRQLAAWWTNTTGQRGSYGFVEWLARSFGDFSHSQECGIGQICAAPNCPAFQASGAPRWAYFVHISLMEMNNLFNSMKDGMSDAETDLSLVVSNMATNFFPWKDPSTNLNHALPWILAVVSSVLSFIPVIGLVVDGLESSILSAISGSTQAITAAGFSQLSTGGSDPVTHQLGTIEELGVLIENVTRSARNDLGTWSTTLYNGDPDNTGKTIKEYMGGGRFTLAYNIQQSFLDNFFLQIWVSKLVNEQWQDKANTPSKTFVMCTNATAACSETSKFTEGSRTCCLYSIDNNANYVPPPAIDVLGNATYNITPSDITASSLHSYVAQGLDYYDFNISSTIEESISLNSNATFLNQGVRFQGVWTLPVCDVGQHGDWVANTAAGLMPCCCGPSCSETIEFWNNTGVLKLQGLHDKCKTQCSTCPTSAADAQLRLIGMRVTDGVYALVMAYFAAMVFMGIW